MRIYASFETLDFSYKFLYSMLNCVLYINFKYAKYCDFFSMKRNVTWQLIKIIILGYCKSHLSPTPNTL